MRAMRCSAAGTRRETGFVLVVTLWILAGIAIVVGLMTLWALEEVRTATREQDRTADQAAMIATRDTVVYLAATRDMTIAGIPVRGLSEEERSLRLLDDMGALRRDPLGDELRADGRAYAGMEATAFSLQDEAGLFPVALPEGPRVDDFLIARGVEASRVPRLRDALLDYVDEDKLSRLDGAEEREYDRAGRPPPPGRRLLMPAELLSVLGWDELPEHLRRSLPDEVTTYYAGAVNMNTMPEPLLPAWVPGCPEACRLLMLRRDEAPFLNAYDLGTRVGVRLPGDPQTDYRFLAGNVIRLTLWGRSGAALRMHVRLTPLADQAAPWVVLAAYPVSRPPDDVVPRSPESDLFSAAAAGGR